MRSRRAILSLTIRIVPLRSSGIDEPNRAYIFFVRDIIPFYDPHVVDPYPNGVALYFRP